MLFEIATGMACIVPVVAIADVIWIAKRNAMLYINDSDETDNDARLLERMSRMIGSLPHAMYVLTSICFLIGVLLASDIPLTARYSGEMLVAKQAKLAYIGDWIQSLYIIINVGLISTVGVLNHLRMLKRLEKGTYKQETDDQVKANHIIAALGGIQNIQYIESTITRMVITTASYNTDACINYDALQNPCTGVAGVVKCGTSRIELIAGNRSYVIVDEIKKQMRG